MNLLDLFENHDQQRVTEALGLYGPFTATINTGERPQSRTKTKKFRREDDAILWAQDWLEDTPQYVFATAEVTDPEGNVLWTTDESLGEQGVSEGHADQQRKIVKRNGQPVGEVGIDRESSPGVGQYYMKHYASGTDNSGYDSREEALDDLRHIMKQSVYGELQGQGVAEAMKPSDIPPSMRDRLTMRDIEAERPQGAYRFRVTFPDGATADFMDFEAAQARAAADRGRISRLNEERKGASARVERILKMLRARHPQAENDLEALIFDFRGQQAQDRTDIARLDAENDMEEADIQRLERMLDLIRRRRGAAAAEPVQEDDIDDAMRDYLARGGKVQQEPARMPRLGTRLRQHGSRHIGQGREARAGQLSGRGANTNPGGNKPVVAAESLRDGEYHVATVILDDGTKKKVRITTDEGFRDRITQHFKKQGRQVTDIDVDYAVRSNFSEETPRFVGAPARPQPQPIGPTKVLPPAPGRPGFVNKPVQETKKKPQPTNPELWSRAKAAARSKFDVWPSAYASAWAAKYYKSKGGGWRMGKAKKKD